MQSNQEENKELEYQDTSIQSKASDKISGIKNFAKNKPLSLVLIAAIFLFVFYLLFLKKKVSPVQTEKLVEVKQPQVEKNIDEDQTIQDLTKINLETEVIQEPEKPVLPSLPDLPKQGGLLEGLIDTPDDANNTIAGNVSTTLQPPAAEIKQPTAQAPAPSENKTQTLKDINPRYAPIVVFSGGGANYPTNSVGYENNIIKIEDDEYGKLEERTSQVKVTKSSNSRHSIYQGKLLSAILETAINTEMPGYVRAIVDRDVYGESGNEILIPRGSRLFGTYSTNVQRGQARVQISWSRVIRSDGVDLTVSLNASDRFGRGGVPGDVDNKYGTVITSSILSSILAVAGVTAAQKFIGNNNPATTTVNASVGSTTTTADPAAQIAYDVTKSLVDTVNNVINNAINTNPVVTIPQGTKITVIVNQDIQLPSLSKIYK